ncbi:AsmA family protein [Methylopila sp. Yamaguchi]|uniref:AsmA family protein n=1 Tax=Methylopila sp. Yamaguchi TaxID=1437817 RepID=UPI000CB3CD6B|nr:AsmA-like C-terminal region-containing protein [Methylopila sp. Yamaguchi]GBD47155.1 outer membrane protein assembly protein AsmA [Methylopila sp. Yamaguchi]
MRRIVLGLAVVALALGAGLGAAAVRTPPGAIEAALRSGVAAGGDLVVEARGESSFVLFPKPRLRLEDVRVSDARGTPMAVVRAVVATPRIGALLMGRVELDELELKTPAIDAEAIDLKRAAALLKARPLGAAHPPRIRIRDAVVTWSGGRLDDLDAGAVWPRAGRPLSVTGAAVFRGRRVEALASIADPLALLSEGRSGAKLRLTAAGARLAFEGAATGGAAPRLEGGLGVRLASLRDMIAWVGSAAPALAAPLAEVSLTGSATVDGDGVAVTRAELVVDDATLVGAARFGARDGRPLIEATLDAGALDVTHYVDGFAPLFGSADVWSAAALDARPFRAVDLDLRLSAGAVTVGDFRLGATAATVGVADGVLDVGVGEAAAYGGVVRGGATIRPDGRTVSVKIGLTLSGVDSERALEAAAGGTRLSGVVDGDLALEGVGGSIAEIVASLNGRASARLASDRAIGGFRAKALALFGLPGRLDVTSAEGTAVIRRGVARSDDLKLSGPLASLALSGEADLTTRRLALAGQLAPLGGAPLRAPVRVEGPIADPRFRLGASSPEHRALAPG